MRTFIFALAFAGLLASAALADVVTLKDGTRREGRIVREDADGIVLEITQGRLKAQITLDRSEIESIEKGETENEKLVKEVDRRRALLRAGDADGWLEFARWLEQQPGFGGDSRDAFEKVLAIDPDNGAARRKLGHHRVAGQWLTPEEVTLALETAAPAEPGKDAPDAPAVEGGIKDLKIALTSEIRKQRQQEWADADARAQAEWLKKMAALSADRAAVYNVPHPTIYAGSGGVVLGPHGYGYYGVRTSTGEVLQYLPATPVYPSYSYYGTGYYGGFYPYGVTTTGTTIHSATPSWGFSWTDGNWGVNAGTGQGLHLTFTKD